MKCVYRNGQLVYLHFYIKNGPNFENTFANEVIVSSSKKYLLAHVFKYVTSKQLF